MREGVAWLGVWRRQRHRRLKALLGAAPVKGCLLCTEDRQRHGRLEALLGAAPVKGCLFWPEHRQRHGRLEALLGAAPVKGCLFWTEHRQRHGRLEALLGAAPGYAQAARAQGHPRPAPGSRLAAALRRAGAAAAERGWGRVQNALPTDAHQCTSHSDRAISPVSCALG